MLNNYEFYNHFFKQVKFSEYVAEIVFEETNTDYEGKYKKGEKFSFGCDYCPVDFLALTDKLVSMLHIVPHEELNLSETDYNIWLENYKLGNVTLMFEKIIVFIDSFPVESFDNFNNFLTAYNKEYFNMKTLSVSFLTNAAKLVK